MIRHTFALAANAVRWTILFGAPTVMVACAGDDAKTVDRSATSCLGSVDEAPSDLACTGLYADFGAKMLAPSARPYAPAVSFWSDGFEKERYLFLPDGAAIDATKIDDWRFPVGTKAWKEIRHGQRRIETRFFWKVKQDRWLQAAYVWSDDGLRATRAEGTEVVVDGKPYHVPKTTECNDCHRSRSEKILGFEALSLSQPGALGVTLAVLAAENRISPAPVRTVVTLPDPALGILHVNCGITCHNASATATAFSTGLRLRLGFDEVLTKPLEKWEAITSSVDVDATSPGWAGAVRIKPGAPEESLILDVMKLRGEGQMPPIATSVVDTHAIGVVEAWVRAMPSTPAADAIAKARDLAPSIHRVRSRNGTLR